MIILGINAQNHDASITVFDYAYNKILFAGHAERYSRIKNDKNLTLRLIEDALSYCDNKVDTVIWHESPFYKKFRYIKSGQYSKIFEPSPKEYLRQFGIKPKKIINSNHHLSHAAGGFYTSKFDSAAIVVIDAIGELSTTTVYVGNDNKINKIYGEYYPHSIGLFYSAITHLIGLKPNEEEYILMGMAAYGDSKKYKDTLLNLIVNTGDYKFKTKMNMHNGVRKLFNIDDMTPQDEFDLAAAAQEIVEEHLIKLLTWVKKVTNQKNLVLSGGVALNCVANEKIAKECGFENIWIMPNPGDAGNSLGAILNITRQHVMFKSAYLGHDIKRKFDSKSCLNDLLKCDIVGIANGRAEFGPRALGNRSLIADPRGPEIKDKMNEIKRRQKFRPFAPIILSRYANEFFDMPVNSSPYMQFTAKCKRPDLYPAICHVDGSSRVQTLEKHMNPQLYMLIDSFYRQTGCPMLVNTSLNIKGEPLVNTWEDAQRFSDRYNVKIY